MTGKMGNKLCGCGLSLNKTLLSLFAFILPLRVPVTYVSSHGSPPLCVLLSPCSLALTFVGWATTYIEVFPRLIRGRCVGVVVGVWVWVCGCRCGCVYTYFCVGVCGWGCVCVWVSVGVWVCRRLPCTTS